MNRFSYAKIHNLKMYLLYVKNNSRLLLCISSINKCNFDFNYIFVPRWNLFLCLWIDLLYYC